MTVARHVPTLLSRPLLYVLATRHADDRLQFFNERFDMGSISMRSLLLG